MGNLPKIWVETLKRISDLEERCKNIEFLLHQSAHLHKPEPKPETETPQDKSD